MAANRQTVSTLQNILFNNLKPFLTAKIIQKLPKEIWSLIVVYSLPRHKLTCPASGELLEYPAFIQHFSIDSILYNEDSIRLAARNNELVPYDITANNVDRFIITLSFNMRKLLESKPAPNITAELAEYKANAKNPRYWQHLNDEENEVKQAISSNQTFPQNLHSFLDNPSNSNLNLACALRWQHDGNLLYALHEPGPLRIRTRQVRRIPRHFFPPFMQWQHKFEDMIRIHLFFIVEVIHILTMLRHFNFIPGLLPATSYLSIRLDTIKNSINYQDQQEGFFGISFAARQGCWKRIARIGLGITNYCAELIKRSELLDFALQNRSGADLSFLLLLFSSFSSTAINRACTDICFRLSEGTLSLPPIRSRLGRNGLLTFMLLDTYLNYCLETSALRPTTVPETYLLNRFFPLIRAVSTLPITYLAAHTTIHEIEEKRILRHPLRFFQPNYTSEIKPLQSTFSSFIQGSMRILATIFIAAFAYINSEDPIQALALLAAIVAGVRMFALGSLTDVRDITISTNNPLFQLPPQLPPLTHIRVISN